MRGLVLFAALALSSAPALATAVTLELPGTEPPRTTKVSYRCGDRTIPVTYINTPDNQFAVLSLGRETVVAVAVMSGSGARYVGQHYQWWSKGTGAELTDLMQEGQAPLACKSRAAAQAQ